MWNTKLTKLLNIEYPILQGGMAWVATHELAAAVSNAGGLGIIGAGNAPGDIIREEIRKAKKLTDKPFGVNVMLMSPFAEDIVDIICDEGVPVATTGAGSPGKYIEKFKEHNVKVIPVVPTVSLAKRVERQGVDAVIVEGTEAGGHIGDLTTMALIPQVSDAVDIPIIAAGGIGDGRGFLAALSLGADGVQMGTRFVCATESRVHENYKNAIIKSKDRDALVTGRSTGHPVRALKNKFMKEFESKEQKGAKPEELELFGAGRLQVAVVEGDVDNGTVMSGQISGLVNENKSCKAIIEDMISSAEEQLNILSSIKRGELNE